MDEIKQSRRFAEFEALVNSYFNSHLAKVMNETQEFINSKQVEEMTEYSTSANGILGMLATAGQPLSDPYQPLKLTGEWNSKTTEDYVQMCRERVSSSTDFQQDLAYMASQWRDIVVKEVGRERYDVLSKQLGSDLAYAYIDHKLEQLMIEKIVKDRMPKSSAEYIIRKAGQSSLLGLSQTLSRSPLAQEIEERGEAAYNPTIIEKGAGRVLGASVDAVMLGGAGSWSSLAKFVGVDVAVSTVTDVLVSDDVETLSVEECISKGIFNRDSDVFGTFRKEASTIKAQDNTLLITANSHLHHKVPDNSFSFWDWGFKNDISEMWNILKDKTNNDKYKELPKVIMPGQEEAYLAFLKSQESQASHEQKEVSHSENSLFSNDNNSEKEELYATESKLSADNPVRTNVNGWDGLLRSFGLDGMGRVAGNLGYVIAMLPDMLLGLFTGKTKSLGLKDNLIPIASIIAGFFVRNPLLKILLVGLGGANLFNKAGKEALDKRLNDRSNYGQSHSGNIQYKVYPDESLNPRITNPVLQGCTLIATIDSIPCTIQISPTVADAYRSGALPLNTLANAVLSHSDRLREMASQNYDNTQQESNIRDRGIK